MEFLQDIDLWHCSRYQLDTGLSGAKIAYFNPKPIEDQSFRGVKLHQYDADFSIFDQISTLPARYQVKLKEVKTNIKGKSKFKVVAVKFLNELNTGFYQKIWNNDKGFYLFGCQHWRYQDAISKRFVDGSSFYYFDKELLENEENRKGILLNKVIGDKSLFWEVSKLPALYNLMISLDTSASGEFVKRLQSLELLDK
jgi:hypothetical protein